MPGQGVEKRVFFLSGLDHETIDHLYANCECFILASKSRSEAFGIVLLEASMFGKPLITSDIRGSGMSDINRDGVTGLTFQNLSSESLASKVNSLLFLRLVVRNLEQACKTKLCSVFQ